MNINKWIALAVLIVVAGGVYFAFFGKNTGDGSQYEAFAKCVTESGAKMYGTFWCPHCKEQKRELGKSWQYIDYIECSTPDGKSQTGECRAAGINGYPTWEFKDGSREEGKLSLTFLSKKTGCPIN